MKKLIVVSHGEFSKGIVNSAKMIMGEGQSIETYSLLPGGSPDEIVKNIDTEIEKNKKDTFIIATDILGGSIHNACLRLGLKDNVKIVSGVNLALLIELLLLEDNDECLDSKINEAINRSKEVMLLIDKNSLNLSEEEDEW